MSVQTGLMAGAAQRVITPPAPEAGEVLVQESVALLAAPAGGEAR